VAHKPRRSLDLPKEAVEALWRGNVFESIKIVREERKIGLQEAKKLVEAYIGTQPALHKKTEQMLAEVRQRFVRWLIGFLVLAAGVGYFVMQGP